MLRIDLITILSSLLLSSIGFFAQPWCMDQVPEVEQTEPEKMKFDPGPVQEYSFSDGVNALVAAKQDWREKRKCVSCHTNGWGLAAQPVIAPNSEEVSVGREFAQDYLKKYLDGKVKPSGQHGSTEGMIATTAFLVMSDARSGEKMHKVTRQALGHAWERLDESGTWEDWLQCNWPPFESDAEFGPTLMLVALGELNEVSRLKKSDQRNALKLCAYLKINPPLSLHAKAMRLWAARYWPDLLRDENEASHWRVELLNAQDADGGWSMATLAGPAWKRDGGEEQTKTSEAYPTAFATYVLLQVRVVPPSGKASGDSREAINKGLLWLKKNQRKGGEWSTRSPRRDRQHYIGRAATSFALMALVEGDEDKLK
jgi:hypothetical protein